MKCSSNLACSHVSKNATIDPFSTTLEQPKKCGYRVFFFFFFPGIYKFLLHPNITYNFLLYTSSQHHNSLLSQLPVTSQHHIQFPNITNSNNKSRTTSSQHKIAERYIYIYKFCTSQKIYKKNFFTFKTALKQPQAVSNNIMFVLTKIFILTFVFTTCLECPLFHLLPF